MSDLSNLVEGLKRLVATPGQFASFYTETTDDDLLGVIMDGLAEAQLDGWMNAFSYDDNGIVLPDLSRGQGALILMYSAASFVRSQLLNVKNKVSYKAGSVAYETEQSSNILTSLLKQFEDRKEQLLKRALLAGASAAFMMADSYVIKAVSPPPGYAGYYMDDAIGHAYDGASYSYNGPEWW